MTTTTLKPVGAFSRLPVVVSIALLCGAGVESRKFRPPPDTKAYLTRVRDLANSDQGIPMVIGDWVGNDAEVEQSAVKLLRPNVILSRNYHNTKTNESAALLFVDCSDARDTIGHYPPICYPSQGFTAELTETKNWQLPEMMIHGTEYNFVRSVFDNDRRLWVDDFFVLPGTGTVPDRGPVIAAAADLQRRFYGVGQVQLVFEYTSITSPSAALDRERAFVELFTPLQKLFKTIETVRPSAGSDLLTPQGAGASPSAAPAAVKEVIP
jgi:hypothetical protein